MLGQSVGSYRITGKIAEGGMGVVYRAEHALIGKSAAIKVLLPELSVNQDVVDRFFNEARAASTIRHPGIVEIFDFGYLSSGMAFIVMEYLDGEPLSHRLAATGRLEERAALTLLRGMAGALAAAHAKGIVHRDLKPDNIYLVPDPDMPGGERPKLLDFGIAKLTEKSGQASHTRTGSVMGTPTYMSPEQCRGAGDVDERSDLYSLGCILYEMLTGRPPFVGEGMGELIAAHMMIRPNAPSTLIPELSASTEALTLQLLAKEPRDRPQSAAELARVLGQGSAPYLATPPTPPVAINSRLSVRDIHEIAPQPAPAATTVGAETTLSGSTMVDERPVRRRAGMFAAIAAFFVVGGGLAAVVHRGSTPTDPAPRPGDDGARGASFAAPSSASPPGSGSGVPAAPLEAPAVPSAPLAAPAVAPGGLGDGGANPAGSAIDAARQVPDAGVAMPTPTRPVPSAEVKPRTERNRGRGRAATPPRNPGTVVPIEDDI